MTATAVSLSPAQGRHDAYADLPGRSQALPSVATAVAWPCEAAALAGVVESAESCLVEPIPVGRGSSDDDDPAPVLWARVPIVLTSCTDGLRERIASCAVAVRVVSARRAGRVDALP